MHSKPLQNLLPTIFKLLKSWEIRDKKINGEDNNFAVCIYVLFIYLVSLIAHILNCLLVIVFLMYSPSLFWTSFKNYIIFIDFPGILFGKFSNIEELVILNSISYTVNLCPSFLSLKKKIYHFNFSLVSLQDFKTNTYFSGTIFQVFKLSKPLAVFFFLIFPPDFWPIHCSLAPATDGEHREKEREHLIFLFVGNLNKNFGRIEH